MEKTARAELIAALVTDRFSGFKDGDESVLESFSDARLEEFRGASEARKSEVNAKAKTDADNVSLSARLKVAEERIVKSEQPLSKDEFIAKAPPEYKELIENHKAQEDTLRAALIGKLKDLGQHTEEELKKKDTKELETLAGYARIEVVDFSGRGVPVPRSAEGRVDYAPPDPYKSGLEAMKTASAAKH